jgi:hypothetical protein
MDPLTKTGADLLTGRTDPTTIHRKPFHAGKSLPENDRLLSKPVFLKLWG